MPRRSVAVLALVGAASAFAPSGVAPALRSTRLSACSISMGKDAADGFFTPVVKAARTVLGDKTLNKIRGDVIAKHSQVWARVAQHADDTCATAHLNASYLLLWTEANVRTAAFHCTCENISVLVKDKKVLWFCAHHVFRLSAPFVNRVIPGSARCPSIRFASAPASSTASVSEPASDLSELGYALDLLESLHSEQAIYDGEESNHHSHPASSPSLPVSFSFCCLCLLFLSFCSQCLLLVLLLAPANMSQLFLIADKDGNGKLDKEELKSALNTLGFTHLGDAAVRHFITWNDAVSWENSWCCIWWFLCIDVVLLYKFALGYCIPWVHRQYCIIACLCVCSMCVFTHDSYTLYTQNCVYMYT